MVKVSNDRSLIVLHDGFFDTGLPYSFNVEETKLETWGYGYWENNNGYANFGFSQQNVGRILTSKGMRPKKTLEGWGLEDFRLGKKKGLKSSNSPAVVQLVTIGDNNCAVVISKFGQSMDTDSRVRTALDGFICKYNGSFTIEEAKNILHCVELKGNGNSRVGKKIDSKCISSNISVIDNNKKITDEKQNIEDEIQQNSSIEEKLEKLKKLFDKKLITKEEYDKKRNEILDSF